VFGFLTARMHEWCEKRGVKSAHFGGKGTSSVL
jgi:hypothetical protein